MKKKAFQCLFVLLLCVAIASVAVWQLLPERRTTGEDFHIPTAVSPVDFNGNGVDDYRDILLGARKDALNHPTYDDRYWEEGYPPDDIGVCTDVVWRAFKNAGYCLREMVDYDVHLRPSAYPNITKPDDNIDFRRVVNLKVFFDAYAVSLTLDPAEIAEWQPGDIVIFANSKGKVQHVGIISDQRTAAGVAYVIHNGGQPEREEDFLYEMTIVGHYRFDASRVDEALLIAWEESFDTSQ